MEIGKLNLRAKQKYLGFPSLFSKYRHNYSSVALVKCTACRTIIIYNKDAFTAAKIRKEGF